MMKKKQQKDNLDAYSLFPELMQNIKESGKKETKVKKKDVPVKKVRKVKAEVRHFRVPPPPPPPDVSWIRTGELEELGEEEDIPTALILLEDETAQAQVSSTFTDLGYQVEIADGTKDAIKRLTSVTYAAVVLHTGYGGAKSLRESVVHQFITWLPITRRRLLFYILVGEYKTLYDMEALALSANIVVNDADVDCMRIILKKGFRDYEELFAPLLDALGSF